MTEDIKTETRNCIDCGNEYEANIAQVLGHSLVLGAGRCKDCRAGLLKEEQDKEKVAQQATIAHKRREWRFNCGIPLRFMEQEFGTFKKERQPKAYEKCLIYAKEYPLADPKFYHSLLLYSNESWGVGKSHLACSIAHHILNKWRGEDIVCPILFTTEPDVLMEIQATYNYSPDERLYRECESDIINRLIRVPLLILDDVGKRRTQDPRFVQRVMFAIIDGRYRAMKPMVLTTNLSPEKLKVYLGGGIGDEASFDRLIEMCGGAKSLKFFQLDGESYRRKREVGG